MSNIDFTKMVTAEQRQEDDRRAEIDAAIASRRAAYLSESDPLRLEADYDALSQGLEPDYTAWLASVAAIKARFPLPLNAESLDS
ncbi:hypothetical protein PFWH6_3896 [Pseudomonas fluorescens WH6]|nr:hypothetical protein PFWH6_3896 [Pseudomonas fluorescens WH6]